MSMLFKGLRSNAYIKPSRFSRGALDAESREWVWNCS